MDRLSPLQEAIGHLCTEFAKLETVIGCAVGFMANPTEARIGHILVAELSFKARLAAFSNLYAERAQPGFDDAPLRSFLSEIHQLEDERNKFIHSFYWPGPVGDPKATRIKGTAKERHGLRIQFGEITATDITAQAEKAKELPNQLDDLMRTVVVGRYDYHSYLGQFYAMFRCD